MIADMLPQVRRALGVTTAYDTAITEGIQNTITFFLRTWFFEKARLKAELPIALGEDNITLPADYGKGPSAVLLTTETNGERLYKRIRKGFPGMLPTARDGMISPEGYWIEGTKLWLDAAMPEAGYELWIWYYTNSWAVAEPWITVDFRDVLFIKSVMDLALTEARKPDVYSAFGEAWRERGGALAIYANEQEFGDSDLIMTPVQRRVAERYPSS